MLYATYTLIDTGYRAPGAGIDPLPEIWGLENRIVTLEDGSTDDQRFEHVGVTGYPASGVVIADNGATCLAAFDGGIDDGGIEIPAVNVPTLLCVDYGWPADTTLDADGLPVAPQPELPPIPA